MTEFGIWMLIGLQLALVLLFWMEATRLRRRERELDEHRKRYGFTAGYMAGLGDGFRRSLTAEYPQWRKDAPEAAEGGEA